MPTFKPSTFRKTFSIAIVASGLLLSSLTFADHGRQYEVTITNLTKGQTFTPQLVTTHSRHVELFTLGSPVSLGVEIVAEGGNTAPLTEELESKGRRVSDVKTIGGLLGPGETSSIVISAGRHHNQLSVMAMLIPTNDTFVALDGVKLPYRGSKSYVAIAYDAGTELNDQKCINIPGPRCQGEGFSEGPNDGDEGFVYVSNGFHDLGTEDAEGNEILLPLTYDWRNPVALVKVTRLK